MLTSTPLGLGWRRDTPDFRDYTWEHPEVADMFSAHDTQLPKEASDSVVDLREYLPAIENQGDVNSSPAHACVSLLQYFECRAHGTNVSPSALFLYKMARKLSRLHGDSGADLRTTVKAMVRFGVPPAAYWTRSAERFDDEPSDPFLYGFSKEYEAIRYARLDSPNNSGSQTLATVKTAIAAGFPAVFGFPVPSSLESCRDVEYRPTFDNIVGGQAVVAVGYDDNRFRATKGSLLFRNSWGREWGEGGYGWLPYAYVEKQLAVDFWTLIKADWLASGEFCA